MPVASGLIETILSPSKYVRKVKFTWHSSKRPCYVVLNFAAVFRVNIAKYIIRNSTKLLILLQIK